jgi:hypothetical protein
LKLISLRISDTQLRSLCLKGLLYTNRLYMKLCPSIVLSAMFWVTHDSSALKPLLLKLPPAISPCLRQLKLLTRMALVDWVLNLLFSLLLLSHRCKPNKMLPFLWVLQEMLGLKLLLNLLMSGLQWNPDANPENRIRVRR